jgi:hypothetical protein
MMIRTPIEYTLDQLAAEAKSEGTIGVVEERLIRKSLTRPAYFRRRIKSQLSIIDEEYLPKTYKLWSKLYDYLNEPS